MPALTEEATAMTTEQSSAVTPGRPVPVTILTGFLGSGKTTLLNYILTEKHGHRIAVIENEFGEVDVDSDLVLTSEEEIFQMTNGCICCVADVRNDLVEILQKLLARSEAFDHILIETSGLADPTPVAATFFIDNDVSRQVALDGVVTLVDALHIGDHLDDPMLEDQSNQAVDQIVSADRIVVNKIDLVDEPALATLEARLRRINEGAQILRSSHAQVDLTKILGINGFGAPSAIAVDPNFLDDHYHVCNDTCEHDADHRADAAEAHTHDPTVSSVSFVFDEPFDRKRLDAFLERLAADRGEDLFRLKGILWIRGDDRRYVLQGVHRLIELRAADAWSNSERASKLVFIGRGLDRPALQDDLEACVGRTPPRLAPAAAAETRP